MLPSTSAPAPASDRGMPAGSGIPADRRLGGAFSGLRRAKAWLAHIALFITPLAVLAISVDLHEARGPSWLGSNCDPEYVYLLNALRLTHGLVPAHRDHPGTPLQMLGATVLEIRNGFPGASELTAQVIRDPELNLDAVRWSLNLTYAMVLVLTGLIAYRKGHSFAQALCLQAAPLLSVTALFEMARVRPEPLLMVLSAMLALVVFLHLERNAERLRGYTVLYACLIGLSLASKITALPLVLVPLILLPATRNRLAFAVGAIAAFLVAILPMITYLPRLAEWFWRVASHRGDYGEGAEGFTDAATLVSFTRVLAKQEAVFALILGASAIVVLWDLVRQRPGKQRELETRALLAIVAAQFLGWLLAAKGHRAHYMLPSEGLIGLNLVLLVRRWQHVEKLRVLILPLGTAIAVLLLAIQVPEVARARDVLIGKRDFQLAMQHRMVTRYKNWTKVYGYMSSSPVHALYFGDSFSAGYFAPWLRQIHPDPKFVYFDTWRQVFRSTKGKIAMDKVMRRYRRLVVYGSDSVATDLRGWGLVPVLAGRPASIYEWTADGLNGTRGEAQ